MPCAFVGKPPRSQLRLLFFGGDGITMVPKSIPLGTERGTEPVGVLVIVAVEAWALVAESVVVEFNAGPAPKPEYSPWALADQSSTKTLEAGLQVEISITPISR